MTNSKKIKLLLCAGLFGVTANNVANASCSPGYSLGPVDADGSQNICYPNGIDDSEGQAAATILDQQSQQTVRQISSNITNRIASDIRHLS